MGTLLDECGGHAPGLLRTGEEGGMWVTPLIGCLLTWMCVRVSAECFRMYTQWQETQQERRKDEAVRDKENLSSTKKETPEVQSQVQSMKNSLDKMKDDSKKAKARAQQAEDESKKLTADANSTWFWGDRARQKVNEARRFYDKAQETAANFEKLVKQQEGLIEQEQNRVDTLQEEGRLASAHNAKIEQEVARINKELEQAAEEQEAPGG